ncbi:MAG: histidinol dehydrogenase [Solirubrobacterales bacterium]
MSGASRGEVLKAGADHGDRAPEQVRATVAEMLARIEAGGIEAVRDYSTRLDDHAPESFVLSPTELDELCARVPAGLAGHIEAAADRIRAFAVAQRGTVSDLELEIEPGVVVGHRQVPVGSVGVYVPGGRYQLISSALMGAIPPRVAGVGQVVLTTPVGPQGTINPATAYAARLAGVDAILALGGVQALGALGFGLIDGFDPVAMIVGAGNAYVAEAKRQLFGRVGIDLLAGPTEIMVIADDSARPRLVAIDLLSQAEHGPTSAAHLVTSSRALGEAVLEQVDALLESWPTREVAAVAWERLGAVVLAGDDEEAVAISDAFGPEHLELQVRDPDWYHRRLRNYGSLFIGEETTVTFGDKAAGPNHTLPTQHAARYTGGLWVGSFLKTLTYQRLTPAGSRSIAPASQAISEAEGLGGHALAAAARLDLSASPRLEESLLD